jgi:hypothetical protein
MTTAAPAIATVYGVFTMGTDYYDTEWVLHTLYASQEQADAAAAALRPMTDEWEDDLYAAVQVQVLNVR